MPDTVLGLPRGVVMMGLGFVLLAASLTIVNRFGLGRQGMIRPIAGGGSNQLAAIAAVVLGLAGGSLIFLGTRAV